MPDRPPFDHDAGQNPSPQRPRDNFIEQVLAWRAGCIAADRCAPLPPEWHGELNEQGCRLLIGHRLEEFNQFRELHPEWVPDFRPFGVSHVFLLSAYMEGAWVADLLNPKP